MHHAERSAWVPAPAGACVIRVDHARAARAAPNNAVALPPFPRPSAPIYRRLRSPALIPMWYTTRFVSLSIGKTV